MARKELSRVTQIERSIITKYRSTIYKYVVRAVQNYQLLSPNDKVAVCVSGGKDSMLLAKCMQELSRHGEFPIDLEFICMDPGYEEHHLAKIKENAEILEIPLKIFKAPIFNYVKTQEDNPCYICARMRRGYLYEKARSLGCNKIALGHHTDDVVETTLMSMFYASEISSMRPKLKSKNFEGLELIRPLYMVKEHDIILWQKYNELEFISCACPLAKKEEDSKRKVVKNIIKDLKKENSEIDDHIFMSIHNVNLETLVGFRKNGVHDTFLTNYDKDKGE